MADATEPDCLECRRKDRIIRQQQIRARQLVDELNDAEETVRVYKRLAYRLLREKDAREE